jgi:hypothetical protein
LSLPELKNYLSLLREAPEGVATYIDYLFWILVGVLLTAAILKVVFGAQFKELYRVIGITAKVAGQAGKAIAIGAAQGLQPPEPYPRAARFFAVLFMLNNYAAFVLFTIIALFFAVLSVTASIPGVAARTAGLAFAFFSAFMAVFFFFEAERGRIKLYPKRGATIDA